MHRAILFLFRRGGFGRRRGVNPESRHKLLKSQEKKQKSGAQPIAERRL